jgi:hypothetical protein
VEVLVRLPLEDHVRGVGELFDLSFEPTTSAWILDADGAWTHNGGQVDLQETLIEQQRRRRIG